MRKAAQKVRPKKKSSSKAASPSGSREVTRDIPHHIESMLWGKAAGR